MPKPLAELMVVYASYGNFPDNWLQSAGLYLV